jgi:Autotransporter beta-domain/Bacterial Ig-like domain (group 3)/IPT/TIG domain
MAASRLTRIAGIFAVGFAALIAGTGQALAASCSTGNWSFSAITGQVTLVDITDDLSGTTSVNVGGQNATIVTKQTHALVVTIPQEPQPSISGVQGGIFVVASSNGDHAVGLTAGNGTMTVLGSNFQPSLAFAITGGDCDGKSSSFTYTGDVTEVDIGGTKAPSFSVNSDSSISVTTPPGIAGVGDIVVVTTHESSSTGSHRFAYVKDNPTVAGIIPTEGLTTIATAVTVTGTNFIVGSFHDGTAATTVSFPCNGSTLTPAGTASVVNQGQINITSPTCSQEGAVNITVTTPFNSAQGQYQFVAPAPPRIDSISPNSGTTLGGTPITISGAHFIGAVKVTFGTVDTTGFTINSDGSISVQSPQMATAGTVNVTVTVNNGTSLVTSTQNIPFTYSYPPPVISSISPGSGSTAGGTNVTIAGNYFQNATAVTIGGMAVQSFTASADGTSITAVTGAHADTNGAGVNVVVTTPSGSGTGSNLYVYGTPAPTVSSVTPGSGPVTGGTSATPVTGTVSIVGLNFTGATGVTFGGVAGTFSVVDDTHITATPPPHAAGFVDVAVTTARGTGVGSSLFSYTSSPPTVTGLSVPTLPAGSAASGTTLGGTNLTITGTNFTGTPLVTIGGVAASQVTRLNATTITVVTPAGTAGAADVIVTTSFGTSAPNPPASTYTYVTPTTPPAPAPTVTSVNPGSGPTTGATPVTITGTNFTGATAVTFGGIAVPGNPVVVNSTTITVLTPPHAVGSVAVAVTTPGGTGTAGNAYQYLVAAPTVTSVLANTGSINGGTVVTVSGTNFVQGGTTVSFGGVTVPAGNVVFQSSSTLLVTTPAHAVGTVDVVATTTAGTGTGTGLFTYVTQALPTVTAISPNSGNTAGGTTVQISGTHFSGATSVTIGGSPATFVVVSGDSTITAKTPAHLPGAVDVVVTTPAGTSGTTGAGLYTYVAGAPTVTAINPANGPIAGGTAVTITGTNLLNATNITIGGNALTAVTVVDATTIKGTTPGHAAGAVNVAVTTPAGNGIGTNLFTYINPVSLAPTVTSVSPGTGVPAGGTTVTITGTNFTNATTVMFGGTNAAFFSVISSTSITARSPAGSGTVHVTVTTANGTSATGAGDQFSYAKAVTSMDVTSSPNPSSLGQAVTFTAKITGSNPTGVVTFTDNGTVIGTATLVSGVATFVISTLPAGSHSVTASYPGDANNASDPETVIQVVNGISDSVRLRQMQMAVMPVVTNMSGQAISGAIDNAIGNGFGGSCQMVSPNGSGFTYCYDGSGGGPLAQQQQGNSLAAIESNMLPEQKQMLEDDFKALGYAEDPNVRKAPPAFQPREWMVWVDVRGADFNRTTVGSDLKGTQVNGTAGVTRRFTPDFLVGVVGGYEHFDFTSQAYNGKLNGDGYTAGGYLGWRLAPALRFDASGAWSQISAADSAGTASGNFTGHRWFASSGVTGTFDWAATVFEPSARVYMLWETENAYTDSLGTLQASHTFDTGRGSAGMKVSHDFATEFGAFVPYVGLYGDYYFSKDDANTTVAPAVTTVPLLQGGAARATGGVAVRFGGGAQVEVGGEYSGLGQDTRIWNLKLHGSVPF